MTNLRDICFQQITDEYWYGLYGPFRLVVDAKNDLFNATKLCHDGGKKFKHYLENKRSKHLLSHLSSVGVPANGLLRVVKGGKGIADEIIRGTYVPKELLLAIATWISPEFYVTCNCIVIEYFCIKFKQDISSLDQKIKETDQKMLELKARNEELEAYSEDICQKTRSKNKLHHMVIVEKNSEDKKDDKFPYYIIIRQKRNLKPALKAIRKKYPKSKVIAKADYTPNGITLFNRCTEKLKYLSRRYNNFSLSGVPIDKFFADIDNLNTL